MDTAKGLNLDDVMGVTGLGKHIERSPAAIRNLVYRRKIPFRKLAGRLIFLRSEIEQWIQQSPGLTLKELD